MEDIDKKIKIIRERRRKRAEEVLKREKANPSKYELTPEAQQAKEELDRIKEIDEIKEMEETNKARKEFMKKRLKTIIMGDK